MSNKQAILGTTLALCCLSPAGGQWVLAAQTEPIRIQIIDYPRPVAAAVREIERQFGIVVTYEDTAYVHPSDIVDITEQVRRDRSNTTTRVLGMRNGSIDLTLTPQPGSLDSQVREVLREVLAQSRALGNAGDFRVDTAPGGYHVIPVSMRGKSGMAESYASPLDTRITLSRQEGSGIEIMTLLAKAIAAATGRDVIPGTMPLGRFDRARVAVDVKNERARDVLWRVMQSVGPDLSWSVLCSVGEASSCAINIHPVPRK